MTVQEIRLLLAFNSWATMRLLETAATLPHEDLLKDMKSSHGSIHGTLLHLVFAERLFLNRWTGGSPVARFTLDDAPTVPALRQLWERTGHDTARYFGTLTDQKLKEPLTYTNIAGQKMALPIWQTALHMIDHSTYHRGQAVSLIRQLGHTPPSTSMAGFFQEAAKVA